MRCTLLLLLIYAIIAPTFLEMELLLLAGGDGKNSERSKWIALWGRAQKRGFVSQRPTILIMTSVQTCISCGGAGIKETLDLIESTRADANVFVVALVDASGDAKRLRKLFPTVTLVEDTANVAETVFNVDTIPLVLIVAPNGSILYRRADPAHNPVTTQELLSHVSYKPILRTLPVLSGISLSEGECTLAKITSSYVDHRNNRALLIDNANNQLFLLDLKKAKVTECIEPDSAMDLLFLPVSDTITHPDSTQEIVNFSQKRNLIRRHFIPMTQFTSVMRYEHDTCEVVAEMYTSPYYFLDQEWYGGKKFAVSFVKSYALLSLAFRQSDRAPIVLKGRKLAASVPGEDSGTSVLLPCFALSRDGKLLSIIQTRSRDSFAVHLIEYSLTSATSEASDFALHQIHGVQLGKKTKIYDDNETYERALSSSLTVTDNNLTVLLPHLNLFLGCTFRDSSLNCTSYSLLSRRVQALFQDSTLSNGTDTQERYIQTISHDKKVGLVFISQPNKQLVIEQYNTFGIVDKTSIINFQPPQRGDALLDARILDTTVGDTCYILCKWKKSRWHLYRVKLN